MKDFNIKALVISKNDNVATLLFNADKDSEIEIKGPSSEKKIVTCNKIPAGHKIALTDIKKGVNIIKYGEIIGIATENIKMGDHVHIHNVDSIRGKVKV